MKHNASLKIVKHYVRYLKNIIKHLKKKHQDIVQYKKKDSTIQQNLTDSCLSQHFKLKNF